MNNTLLDVSINTMIGNLPGIMNHNNDMIEQEFSTLFTYVQGGQPVLSVDVSNNTISSHTGYFRNINIGGKSLDASTVEHMSRIDASIQQLTARVDELESDVQTIINQQHPYSSEYSSSQTLGRPAAFTATPQVYESARPSNSGTYDMTNFFMAGSGDEEPVIVNATVETLIFEQPYRTQAGIVIPLYMGTCQVGDRLCSMVYHDHLNADGRIERIYVPIETGVDGNSIMRAGNPGIITFQSVQPAQRKK